MLATFLFSKMQTITKMFLQICLHLYGVRLRVAPVLYTGKLLVCYQSYRNYVGGRLRILREKSLAWMHSYLLMNAQYRSDLFSHTTRHHGIVAWLIAPRCLYKVIHNISLPAVLYTWPCCVPFLGEKQRIAFRLMLSSCVSVCLSVCNLMCVCRVYEPQENRLRWRYRFFLNCAEQHRT